MHNYVSVTGGVNDEEVERILEAFSPFKEPNYHSAAIGFLVSEKSMSNPDEQQRNRRFAPFNDVDRLMRMARPHALTVMHYNPGAKSLSSQVARALKDTYPDALQLNGTGWHPIREVARIKEQHERIPVILQVSGPVAGTDDPTSIARKVSSYGETIDYVLLDASRGRGIPLDVERAARLYDAVRSFDDYKVTFAGGLDAGSVAAIVPRLRSLLGTNDFSLDAEGALRDRLPGEQYFGNDVLNHEKCESYIKSAYASLQ